MTKTILAVQINPEGYVFIKYIHPYLCSHAECRRPAITLHKNKFEIHVIGAMGFSGHDEKKKFKQKAMTEIQNYDME